MVTATSEILVRGHDYYSHKKAIALNMNNWHAKLD